MSTAPTQGRRGVAKVEFGTLDGEAAGIPCIFPDNRELDRREKFVDDSLHRQLLVTQFMIAA